MSEAERLYTCIMHDFHDGVDRKDRWVKEIQLTIDNIRLDDSRELIGIVNKGTGNHAETLMDVIHLVEKRIKIIQGE